ncbi:MAG: hypothetical protein U0X40_05610 [Ferruginibacter sp.]
MRYTLLLLMNLAIAIPVVAQATRTDSARIASTLTELARICRSVDFKDPKTQEQGSFYKAASYIVYRGEDNKRKWKDFANYRDAAERKAVDEVCLRINATINRDPAFRITGYQTQKESEGTWHALTVSYTVEGESRSLLFAFLYVKGRYALGDIDKP